MQPEATVGLDASGLLARLDAIRTWPYPKAVLIIVGIGYLISFFDITNIAFALPVFSHRFGLTLVQQAYPITASLVGYVFGSFLNGFYADLHGRKRGLMAATIVFSAGCILTGFADSFMEIVAGRLLTGMGIGAEIAAVSAYIAELAPATVRGRYIGIANIFSMAGLSIVPVVALLVVPSFPWGWRLLFLVGAAGLLSLLFFGSIPESPRWLVKKGRLAQAESVIRACEARGQIAGAGLATVSKDTHITVDVESGPTSMLFRKRTLSRVVPLLLIWFLVYVATYSWNGLGPTFFVKQGYTLRSSILFEVAGAIGYPVGAFFASIFGDMFERRKMIGSALIVWALCLIPIPMVGHFWLICALTFATLCCQGFYYPMLYTLTAESFPTEGRATGISVTDGIGHLGGAIGPIAALNIYALVAAPNALLSTLGALAAASVAAALLLPLTVKATRRSMVEEL